MRIRRFSPGYAILTLAFVILTVSLGFWQLDRAEQKTALIEMYRDRGKTTVPLESVIGDWENNRYRRVEAQGSFLTDKQIFLENQVHRGQVGYHAYVPFRTGNGDTVLVNTGWQKALRDKTDIANGQVRIEGLLRPPPEVGIRLGNLDQTTFERPYRTPYMDIDWIGKRLDLQPVPFVLLLAGNGEGAVGDDWSPVRMPPETHRGYAFTWFSLAFALLVMFLIYGFKKE